MHYIQGDQLNMAVCFWYLVKRDANIQYCTVAYTVQVKFYEVPEQHVHWSPCRTKRMEGGHRNLTLTMCVTLDLLDLELQYSGTCGHSFERKKLISKAGCFSFRMAISLFSYYAHIVQKVQVPNQQGRIVSFRHRLTYL